VTLGLISAAYPAGYNDYFRDRHVTQSWTNECQPGGQAMQREWPWGAERLSHLDCLRPVCLSPLEFLSALATQRNTLGVNVKDIRCWVWWCTPVIPATREAEVTRKGEEKERKARNLLL
jgi:hypothetical protein